MFEDFLQQNKKHDNSVTIDFSGNIAITPETLWEKFKYIDTMEDSVIIENFIKYFNMILDSIFISKNENMVTLFTNHKFISAATTAMHNLAISDSQRKRCNKLVYDYIIRNEKDEETVRLLIGFSKVVNKDKTPKLLGYGLTSETATMLALARYSSEKENVNVKRLNKVIMKNSSKIMTEQMVVNIYCTLFDSALAMFEGVMYDVQSYQNMNVNQIEVYGTITLAVLDIINDLPLHIIETVLTRFIENKNMMYSDKELRFNLRSFSPEDYPRLDNILNKMESDGIILPS